MKPGVTEETVRKFGALTHRVEFRSGGNMPSGGADALHGRIPGGHGAARRRRIVVEHPCGQSVLGGPHIRSFRRTRRLIAQVLGHPHLSADRRRRVGVAPVVQFSGITAGIVTVERTALAPVVDVAAQRNRHVDLGQRDRHIVLFAADELRRRDGLAVALAVGCSDCNGQRRLLGNQDHAIRSAGLLLESPDLRDSGVRLRRSRRDSQIHGRRRHEPAHGNGSDRRAGVIRQKNGKLRHQVVENHAHRSASGFHVALHGSQQVRRGATAGLVRRHGKFRRHARRRVGMIGRERRGFVQVVVPQQSRPREGRTLVGHGMILGIGLLPLEDGQPDLIPVVEMEARNTGFDRRHDFHGRMCVLFFGAAGYDGTCSQNSCE